MEVFWKKVLDPIPPLPPLAIDFTQSKLEVQQFLNIFQISDSALSQQIHSSNLPTPNNHQQVNRLHSNPSQNNHKKATLPKSTLLTRHEETRKAEKKNGKSPKSIGFCVFNVSRH
jgi:hypothetical protein